MTCAGTNTIAALLAGGIDGAAADRLEAHLDACAACRRLVADLGRGLSAIGEAAGTGGGLPRVGDRVGRFEIARVIGVGGMGVVFEARDPTLDRRVAVKLLRPDIAAGDVLLGEAQAMARLQHPNIAVVHDVGRSGGQLYVCMEYIAGMTLRAWLGERTRGWREIARVFVAAGRGLAYVHAVGLVHRDFKPDNVLIGRDGRVVVTDFGLAHVVDRGARGHVVGTPAYMAPEQRRGENVDARADQYAFCAALREAVGGRAPRWLGRAIARGLAARPEDRFASVDALLAVIDVRLARRPVARIAIVAAAAVVAALAVPRATDVVTRVIDRPVVERVVETRPASGPPVNVAAAPVAPTAIAASVALRVDEAPAAMSAARAYRRIGEVAAAVRSAPAPRPAVPARPTLVSFDAVDGALGLASCDDGSERTCPLDEPACPPTTIASIVNGCWTCAEEHTCAPLGFPRSCNDGSKLACALRPPDCPGHEVPSVHAGCWRCEDPFTCGAVPPTRPPQPHHPPHCGNGACEAGETATSCPADCHDTGSNGSNGPGSGSSNGTPTCGNGFCEIGEDHASCPIDCCEVRPDGSCVAVCGNGFCEVGEDHASCPADCR